jgi:hypothetical protein
MFAAVVVLPSEGKALVKRVTLGGSFARDNIRAARSARYDSVIAENVSGEETSSVLLDAG